MKTISMLFLILISGFVFSQENTKPIYEPSPAATGTIPSSQVNTQTADTIAIQNPVPELMNSNVSVTPKQVKKQNTDNEPKLLNAAKKEEDLEIVK
jgi:uncharacterized iron-regulated protein